MTDHSFDVIVIGGGHAGLCAALTARERGASVLLLESAPQHMRGGNSRHTRNLRSQHDHPTEFLTGCYSADAFFDDLMRVTHGETNEALARLTIEKSADLVRWLQRQEVRFQKALTGTLSLDSTNPFFLGGGCALMNALYRRADALGVEVRYEHRVTKVACNSERFEHVTAHNGENTVSFRGKSLVVASGGFQGNIDKLSQYWGPAAHNFLVRGTPHNRGDNLFDLVEQGFDAIGDPTQCHAVAIDARAPKFDGGIASRLDSIIFGIVINKLGERFYDEGEDFWPRRYAIWGRMVAQQPQQIAFSIVDSKVIDRFMPSLHPPLSAMSLADACGPIGSKCAKAG